jgi:hypothetical protein
MFMNSKGDDPGELADRFEANELFDTVKRDF